MSSLEVLVADDCGIMSPLPAEWSQWSSLRSLMLEKNAITTLPPEWSAMTALDRL